MKNSGPLSELGLSEWQPTRDTLHAYCRVLGKIRRSLTPAQKHWWHVSLRVQDYGLSTSLIPIPGRENTSFEVWLDLAGHQLAGKMYHKDEWKLDLSGQSTREFMESTLDALAQWQIFPEIDRSLFEDPNPRAYDRDDAEKFWEVIYRIDHLLKQFKTELPDETSPVQFWPHNFDLALMWLTGRKIPGQDPQDEERSDEQMAFGFSTGDAGTPDAYSYVTAYPWPDGLVEEPLPEGAVWHTQGWKGALLPYAAVAGSGDSETRLIDFFRHVYRVGSVHLR
jgi:hypothetical protein